MPDNIEFVDGTPRLRQRPVKFQGPARIVKLTQRSKEGIIKAIDNKLSKLASAKVEYKTNYDNVYSALNEQLQTAKENLHGFNEREFYSGFDALRNLGVKLINIDLQMQTLSSRLVVENKKTFNLTSDTFRKIKNNIISLTKDTITKKNAKEEATKVFAETESKIDRALEQNNVYAAEKALEKLNSYDALRDIINSTQVEEAPKPVENQPENEEDEEIDFSQFNFEDILEDKIEENIPTVEAENLGVINENVVPEPVVTEPEVSVPTEEDDEVDRIFNQMLEDEEDELEALVPTEEETNIQETTNVENNMPVPSGEEILVPTEEIEENLEPIVTSSDLPVEEETVKKDESDLTVDNNNIIEQPARPKIRVRVKTVEPVVEEETSTDLDDTIESIRQRLAGEPEKKEENVVANLFTSEKKDGTPALLEELVESQKQAIEEYKEITGGLQETVNQYKELYETTSDSLEQIKSEYAALKAELESYKNAQVSQTTPTLPSVHQMVSEGKNVEEIMATIPNADPYEIGKEIGQYESQKKM